MFRDRGFDTWREQAARRHAASPQFNVAITCKPCGHRQRLARTVQPLEVFWFVCHNCEASIRVAFDVDTPVTSR